jgi:hypothetical protein
MDRQLVLEGAPPRVLVETHSKDLLSTGASLLFLILLAVLSVRSIMPPAAAGAAAPPADFSSARAMRHLQRIAQNPHPVGSAEHGAVREYILKELEANGLRAEVQKATGVNAEWEGPLQAGTVGNIVAKLPGTQPAKAVMLVGHYDSALNSPGASDDGVAVAAILETARALKAGGPLKNDVIFLFTDAEESGLLGAEAFVKEHPWAKDVGLALNFEARGTSGPAIMFETSEDNGWLIDEFARAAPSPVAHSLACEIYKLLPNDTDLSVFKRAGLPGLNFAYVNGLSDYHTQLDSYHRTDERSLQHQGSYALALARHFGNLSLEKTRGTDAVYFDLFGKFLVHYSSAWALPLMILAAALYAAVVAAGVRRRRLTARGIAAGAAALLLSVVCVALCTAALSYGLGLYLGGLEGSPQGGTYGGWLFLLGFLSLTLAVATAVYLPFFKRVSARHLLAGGLLWLVVLGAACSLYLKGASYLFLWPLLFGAVALAGLLAWGADEARPSKLVALLSVCAAPAIVLLSPLVYQIFAGMALEFIVPLAVVSALFLALLLPTLKILVRRNLWAVSVASASAGACLVAAGILLAGFDGDSPKQNSVFYALNADDGKAVWASLERQPDEWTSQFIPAGARDETLPAFFHKASRGRYLQGEAPAVALAAPEVTLLEDRTADGVRSLRVLVKSARQAQVMSVYLDSAAEVLSATVNGRKVVSGETASTNRLRNRWAMRYYAVPAEGVELLAEVKASQPITLRVVDQSYGIPEAPGMAYRPRPGDMIPAPSSFNNSTLVSKSYTF